MLDQEYEGWKEIAVRALRWSVISDIECHSTKGIGHDLHEGSALARPILLTLSVNRAMKHQSATYPTSSFNCHDHVLPLSAPNQGPRGIRPILYLIVTTAVNAINISIVKVKKDRRWFRRKSRKGLHFPHRRQVCKSICLQPFPAAMDPREPSPSTFLVPARTHHDRLRAAPPVSIA